MAQIFGQSARYVSQEALNARRRLVLTAFLCIGTICIICGVTIGLSLRRLPMPVWGSAALSTAGFVAVWLIGKRSLLRLDRLEKERVQWQKGANGEAKVVEHLQRLPDAFTVINDVSTPHGNLDHVVVGPTGVFILDAKDWRGVVSADGNGELLLNQKPTDKRYVRRFVRQIMDIKDKVKALTHGLDPYFQAVFVFTSARVEAPWSATRSAACIRDEQLFNYIVERQPARKLGRQEVEKLAQAFLALARMDPDFTQNAGQNQGHAAAVSARAAVSPA